MENTEKAKEPGFWFSVRFFVALMAFLGYCIQYMNKINLGIAIVCMVNYTAINQKSYSNDSDFIFNDTSTYTFLNFTSELAQNNSNDNNHCLFKEAHGKHIEGSYVWSKSVQGFTLSAYFWGYLITQIPGGYLASKYGARNVLGYTNLLAGALTVVSPFCANGGYIVLSICRFFIGAAHGALWPAMSSLFVHWTPTKERTKIIGTATAGAWVGNIIALPIGGILCLYGFGGGWPSIFYIFGILNILWSLGFLFYVSDSPNNHRFISDLERDYILENTKKELSAKEGNKLATPWLEIFKSKICWATFIVHLCNNWGNYLYLTQLPSFMKDVLKFDIKSNGLMSALPYVACALSTCFLALISEKILNTGYLSKTNLRRIFNGIGLVGPLVMLICLSFVNCENPYLGVVFLVIALFLNGFYWSAGPLVNINDIAGVHSGVIFGIANTFGTVPGVICPYIVGILTKHQTQQEWQIVFIICAVVYFIGSVIYWIWADSHLQTWALVENVQQSTLTLNEISEETIQI